MSAAEDMIQIAVLWSKEGRKTALATVISTRNSSPRAVGSQLLIDSEGNFEGSVSGGCIEGEVVTEALAVIGNGMPKRLTYGISNGQIWELGLSCGGEIEIFIEKVASHDGVLEELAEIRLSRTPVCRVVNLSSAKHALVEKDDHQPLSGFDLEIQEKARLALKKDCSKLIALDGNQYFLQVFNPPSQIVIIGAVHVAQSLALIARKAGYQILVIDPREAYANSERFPDVELNIGWPDEIMNKMDLYSNTAVVVLSHDPKIDDPALLVALRSPVFYIGALGSKKTHSARLERLEASGAPKSSLRRINGPIGLEIGAKNPTEIAIAIIAQILEQRSRI